MARGLLISLRDDEREWPRGQAVGKQTYEEKPPRNRGTGSPAIGAGHAANATPYAFAELDYNNFFDHIVRGSHV